jgi:Dyp-type peroxidase family
MSINVPAREAPFPFLGEQIRYVVDEDSGTGPDTEEPALRVDQIQGNILAGFNKDNQTLIFLRIEEPKQFRKWLQTLVPFVATTEEVLSFNRLFKSIRSRRRVETRTVTSTWLNIAFSFAGLRKLDREQTELFKDEAFRQGLARRSESLSDPVNEKSEGFQKNWVIGGAGNEPDLIAILASDSPEDLGRAVIDIESSIYTGAHANGEVIPSGVSVVFKQRGATLPDPLRGHEHFGFLDGVSQPGIKGTAGKDGELITPRQNPADPGQGKPGQDRLWPGEFVFGYPGQDPKDADKKGRRMTEGPSWSENGSFLVFRRLRQDVGAFHDFLKKWGGEFKLGPDLFGAKCVGRWPSGAPVERAPQTDNPAMSRDDCANNAFDFQNPTIPAAPTKPGQCMDNFPDNLAQADALGAVCPFAGHIRKAYPRDDVSAKSRQSLPNEADTETHRLLRRGIPFGTPFDPTVIPDDGNRGLLFLAYQTSIVDQFEFVIKNWVNDPDFKDKGAGHDPILGQSNEKGSRDRSFKIRLKNGIEQTIRLEKDFVIPTGGGYFFAPSIDALCELSGLPASGRKGK